METFVETVSTHVLVDAKQLERLRALARRTRISQSEYLREAVDNLLAKYVGQQVDAIDMPPASER